MRRVAVVTVVFVLGSVFGLMLRVVPASGSTPTQVSPGILSFGSPSFATVYVFNPTGHSIHVKEHLVSPSGYPSPPADGAFDVAPHAQGVQSLWFCPSGTCFGTPVITIGSGRAVVSMDYNDNGAFRTLPAGDFKRF
jgi:hypothetical protein